MPAGYFKKYRKKSSRARRRRATARKKGSLTKRVKRLESHVEKKYDIFLLSNVGEANIPNSQEMTNNLGTATLGYQKQIRDVTPVINQGTNDNERIGDSVNLKSIDFRAVVSYQANADLPATGKIGKGDVAHCRVMLVWDNVPTYQGTTNPTTGQPVVNNNPLSWNHMLAVKPDATETPAVALAPYNHDIVTRDRRISVLFDKKFDMVAGTDRTCLRINLKKSWLNQKLKYLFQGNNPINRQLKFCFMSNRVTGEAPHIYCSQKSIYTDQ